jgi:translation initiation factor IF-3
LLSTIFFRRIILIKDFQVNEQIRDREVKVIDSDGTMLGVMSAAEAQRVADQRNLDLVKISPNAVPPVCKVLDYGKFKFEIAKKEKEAKKNQKIVEIKEIRLTVGTDVGDINVKAKNTIKFLDSGDKVKVSVRMRGRQQAHPDIALEVLRDFFELVKEHAAYEKQPTQEGGRFATMFLSPLVKK